MAQYVTVKDFKVGDFKDQNGNTWCEVEFKEFPGQYLRWVVKEPSSVHPNDKVYGHTEKKTSQAGKEYTRFYRDKEPEQGSGYSYSGSGKSSSGYVDHHEDIKAEWAIGLASEKFGSIDKVLTTGQKSIIKNNALFFHSLVDEIKGGSTITSSDNDPGPSDSDAPDGLSYEDIDI